MRKLILLFYFMLFTILTFAGEERNFLKNINQSDVSTLVGSNGIVYTIDTQIYFMYNGTGWEQLLMGGAQGPAGVNISNAQVNSTGWLNMTLSNGTVLGPWNISGTIGANGTNGTIGANGVITYINQSGIQYSQPILNFINSANATFTIANETSAGRINITVNSLSIKQGMPLIKNPYAVNTTTTQVHGLGVMPNYLDIYLTAINTTVGYTAGNIIKFNGVQDTGASMGFIVKADDTNVILITGIGLPEILNATSRTEIAIVANNWNITIVPYMFQP